jgi:hypothetical protein
MKRNCDPEWPDIIGAEENGASKFSQSFEQARYQHMLNVNAFLLQENDQLKEEKRQICESFRLYERNNLIALGIMVLMLVIAAVFGGSNG